MWYKNIADKLFGLVTKHACDRQTDGQHYDSQDRVRIAASRGNDVQIYTTAKFTRLSVTVGVAGLAWSLHGKQT